MESWLARLVPSESDVIYHRYPYFGKLDIKDHKEYLSAAKKEFSENMIRPMITVDKISNYKLVAVLGRGAFSEVLLGEYVKNKKHYAIKVMSKDVLLKYHQTDHVLSEKLILQGINCPFAIFLVRSFVEQNRWYFVLPVVVGGDLFQVLAPSGFAEMEAMFYVAQIVLAIEYLHYLNLVYRDIKPENILIDHTGYLKLADFGFCKELKHGRTYTVCGTPAYIAPEVIEHKGYGKSVDWWGIGVLAYELASGTTPFLGGTSLKTHKRVINNEFYIPQKFSLELRDFVVNLLQKDLSKRLGNLKGLSEDVKNHKWFRPISWMAVLNKRLPGYKTITREAWEQQIKDKQVEYKTYAFQGF